MIRDPKVLREARALWTDVYWPGFETDALRELTQSLESLNVDDLAQHGALMAQSVAGSAMLGDHAQLIAEQAVQAAEVGLSVAEQTLHSLSESGLTMSHIDEAKLDQHLHSIDTSTLEQHFHALEKSADHLDQQIEHSMRELEHNLDSDLGERMKDLHHDLRDFDFKEFGHWSEFGRSVDEAARRATEEMRALVERAIKNGQASVVR